MSEDRIKDEPGQDENEDRELDADNLSTAAGGLYSRANQKILPNIPAPVGPQSASTPTRM